MSGSRKTAVDEINFARIERFSLNLDLDTSSAPREVRAAAGRVRHAMKFDDVPERTDLALVLMYLVEARALSRERSVLKNNSRVGNLKKKPMRFGNPKGRRTNRRSKLPSVEEEPRSSFYEALVEADKKNKLRRKLGLSPRKTRRDGKSTWVIDGDDGD